jgi:riboflavin synthase
MFTGIIENQAQVKEISSTGTNKSFWLHSTLTPEFKVDQSIAHNGVCLTVEAIQADLYRVTAIEETLKKTELYNWKPGTYINLERSLTLTNRLDGHFVQGHVDTTATCESIKDLGGSREICFKFPKKFAELLIEKGSICVNGISLTAFKVKKNRFTVGIIPYTFEHTNLRYLKEGDPVNLEFDLIGKYILRKLSLEK